jgi:hypothetical protein
MKEKTVSRPGRAEGLLRLVAKAIVDRLKAQSKNANSPQVHEATKPK